jgi:serine/threonine protein kinase
MALVLGTRLGPYEIQSLLGTGGMGEVYRARDTRLDRTVAIKILREHFADNPDRRARFEREARAISKLNHPHICTLYDVSHDHGTDFLVMQYLEGETLAARIARGRPPLDEAIRLAIDIAEALDRAHRAGVVHRDLKPANIMVTKTGAVLLDFGLARIAAACVAGSLPAGPTGPPTLTVEGTLLGTLRYMAPEQLEGGDADARSDIWALGCVLYEMIAGACAFKGDSQSRVIAAIMSGPPPDIAAGRVHAPAALDRVVRTCLARNPDDRFHSAHDVSLELRWMRDPADLPTSGSPRPARSTRRWLSAAAIAAGLVAAASIGYLAAGRGNGMLPVVRFDVAPPAGWTFDRSVAISPDGDYVAAVATPARGPSQLWLRRLDDDAGRFLPGTQGAASPFWAPDSRAVGFFADGKLKRIEIRGLTAITICDAPAGRGAAWMVDDQIVFSPDVYAALVRVPAAGGNPVPFTSLVAEQGEVSHRYPFPLPNRRLTYLVNHRNAAEDGVWLVSLDDPSHPRKIVRSGNAAQFAGGMLFFTDRFTLLAQRFDPADGRLAGDPATVATSVAGVGLGQAAFSLSNADSALVRRFNASVTQLAWADRHGQVLESLGDAGLILDPRLSPDGHRVAFVRVEHDVSTLWTLNVDTGAATRVISDQLRVPDAAPAWSRDGNRIVFSSARGPSGSFSLYITNVTGGPVEPFAEGLGSQYFSGSTPDGQTSVWMQNNGRETQSIVVAGPDRKPATYYDPGYDIEHAAISPDGRFIAFSSNQSGRREVFVIGFPTPGVPRQISVGGGTQPRWRGDGRELWFWSPPSRLMSVAVNTSGHNTDFGSAAALFDAPILEGPGYGRTAADVVQYDALPDGSRFILNMVREAHPPQLTVLLNWSRSIERRGSSPF